MADPFKQELEALRNLVMQSRELIDPAVVPDGRAQQAHALLDAATHLVDDLLNQSPAKALGSRGGKSTAKRGSEYFRELAAKRKTLGGGRPPKTSNQNSKRK